MNAKRMTMTIVKVTNKVRIDLPEVDSNGLGSPARECLSFTITVFDKSENWIEMKEKENENDDFKSISFVFHRKSVSVDSAVCRLRTG